MLPPGSQLPSRLRLSQPHLSISRETSVRTKKRAVKRDKASVNQKRFLKEHLKLSRGGDLRKPRRAKKLIISSSNSRKKIKARTSPIASREETRISEGSLATLTLAVQEAKEVKVAKVIQDNRDKSAHLEWKWILTLTLSSTMRRTRSSTSLLCRLRILRQRNSNLSCSSSRILISNPVIVIRF